IDMAGIDVVRVTNTMSGLQAVNNQLIPGEVQFMFPSWGSAVQAVKAGKLRPLAVTSALPSKAAPGLPTGAEALPGYEIVQSIGVFAPARTPPTIVHKLHQEFASFLKSSHTQEQLVEDGMEAVASSPEELGARIKSEMAKWRKLIRDLDIRA